MKVGTGFGGTWLDKVPKQAQRAEELGFDFAGTPETQHDSILAATIAAASTEKLEIQTSVTIAFPRSPTVLAMEAWDIQHLSRGRFVLGLGSQVKGHNERRFSTPWTPPATRMKEYVQMVKAVWRSFQEGEKPDFVGKNYQYRLMTPNFNPGPIDYGYPKVAVACVGDAMARAAGEAADAVFPHGFVTDRYMREVVLPNVAVGLKRSGRTWDDIEISGGGFTAFGENQSEIEQKLEGIRQQISFYGSTRTYHEVFRTHGWEDLGVKLHEMSLQGKWDEMPGAVPDDVLHNFAQTATYDKLPEFIRDHREYASRISLQMPTDTPEQVERFQHVLKQVQAIETPGVPRGQEDISAVDASPRKVATA